MPTIPAFLVHTLHESPNTIVKKTRGDLWYTVNMGTAYAMTTSLREALQAIELEREKSAGFTLPRLQVERLRLGARVRAAHGNARLEGNRLSADEATRVLIDGHKFPGWEGEVLQLKRIYQALEQVDAWGEAGKAPDANSLAKLHAILSGGKRAKPSPFRSDPAIPARLEALFDWLNQAEEPPALQAGIAHYEIYAIQPFDRLNTCLGRLTADWLLGREVYPWLRRAALAEAFANDQPAYQSALAQPETTAWLEHFTQRLATAYSEATRQVEQAAGTAPQPLAAASELPRPDGRARRVLRLFETQDDIAVKDVMRILGLPLNPARQLLESWVQQGWLVHAGLRFRMSETFKQHFAQILHSDR